ncbi:M15 family metallopeptidase [Mesorhizobium sp. WSM4982]|uniref:M15 family metallopeptidase n=1 Tax=Mesorhizobium sp. WSM4982 TaxID=3038550 RepID=UPI0024158CBC|nr:M15 family metallopeptidase [Mesorhizobium sp. WSM4982]MDG4856405.1 M15 family metallopeptidase [Mesorhizobium sp. WSM4982]
MPGYKLSAQSMKLMTGVHPDLVKVIVRAQELAPFQLIVTEGLRSVAQQRENIRKGVSWTMNSRHLTGHAVDVAPAVNGKASYSWPLYYKLAPIVKQAAHELGVPVEWGGDWRKNKDGPHWQLPFRQYPAHKSSVGLLGMDEMERDEVRRAAPTNGESDAGAAIKTVGLAGAGGFVSLDTVSAFVQDLSAQQYELTSHDAVRVAIAVVLIGAGVWMAWKAYHKAKGGEVTVDGND